MGILSSIINGIFGIFNQKASDNRQFRMQSALQFQQNDFALQQMAKQNEYNVANYEMQRDDERAWNNPMAERSRLVAAGYSPMALVSGAGGSPISASLGSVGSPSGPSGGSTSGRGTDMGLDLSSIVSLSDSLKNSESQRNLNKSQEDLNRANADKARAETDSYQWLNKLRQSLAGRADAQTVLDKIDAAYRAAWNELRNGEISASTKKTIQDTFTSLSQMNLNEAQAEYAGALKGVAFSQFGLNVALTDKALAETETESVRKESLAEQLALTRVNVEEVRHRIERDDSLADFKKTEILALIRRMENQTDIERQHLLISQDLADLKVLTSIINPALFALLFKK